MEVRGWDGVPQNRVLRLGSEYPKGSGLCRVEQRLGDVYWLEGRRTKRVLAVVSWSVRFLNVAQGEPSL